MAKSLSSAPARNSLCMKLGQKMIKSLYKFIGIVPNETAIEIPVTCPVCQTDTWLHDLDHLVFTTVCGCGTTYRAKVDPKTLTATTEVVHNALYFFAAQYLDHDDMAYAILVDDGTPECRQKINEWRGDDQATAILRIPEAQARAMHQKFLDWQNKRSEDLRNSELFQPVNSPCPICGEKSCDHCYCCGRLLSECVCRQCGDCTKYPDCNERGSYEYVACPNRVGLSLGVAA